MKPDEWSDEVMEEVRRAKEKVFEDCGGDLDKLVASLQESQERHGDRLVRHEPHKLPKIREQTRAVREVPPEETDK